MRARLAKKITKADMIYGRIMLKLKLGIEEFTKREWNFSLRYDPIQIRKAYKTYEREWKRRLKP